MTREHPYLGEFEQPVPVPAPALAPRTHWYNKLAGFFQHPRFRSAIENALLFNAAMPQDFSDIGGAMSAVAQGILGVPLLRRRRAWQMEMPEMERQKLALEQQKLQAELDQMEEELSLKRALRPGALPAQEAETAWRLEEANRAREAAASEKWVREHPYPRSFETVPGTGMGIFMGPGMGGVQGYEVKENLLPSGATWPLPAAAMFDPGSFAWFYRVMKDPNVPPAMKEEAKQMLSAFRNIMYPREPRPERLPPEFSLAVTGIRQELSAKIRNLQRQIEDPNNNRIRSTLQAAKTHYEKELGKVNQHVIRGEIYEYQEFAPSLTPGTKAQSFMQEAWGSRR